MLHAKITELHINKNKSYKKVTSPIAQNKILLMQTIELIIESNKKRLKY